MAEVRIHRVAFSTNVERVALAAAHKSLEVEWIDHPDEDRSGIEEVSGQSLVPVAEFGPGAAGQSADVVRGSMRIVERFEADHPEPALFPADPLEAARERIFISWFDRVWKGPPNALDVKGDPPPDADQLRRRANVWTGWIAGLLSDGRPFLGGDHLGAADICAFPFLKYATVDPEPDDEQQFHYILVDLLRLAAHPGLDEWVARVDALPRA